MASTNEKHIPRIINITNYIPILLFTFYNVVYFRLAQNTSDGYGAGSTYNNYPL
jgi:hypothetical protein